MWMQPHQPVMSPGEILSHIQDAGWGGVGWPALDNWCGAQSLWSLAGSVTLDLGLSNLQLPDPLVEKIREVTSQVCHEESQ